MSAFLYILGWLALFAGVAILAVAESALHEIESFILFLIGAVLLSGSAIVDAVKQLKPVKSNTPDQQQGLRTCVLCNGLRPASEKVCGECGNSMLD